MSLVPGATTASALAAKRGTTDSLTGADSVGGATDIGNPPAAGTAAATKRPLTGKVREFAGLSKGRGNTLFRTTGASAGSATKPDESADTPAIPTGYSQAPAVGDVTTSHEPTLARQHAPASASMHHDAAMFERHQARWRNMLETLTKATEMLAQLIREGAQSIESAAGQ